MNTPDCKEWGVIKEAIEKLKMSGFGEIKIVIHEHEIQYWEDTEKHKVTK